MAEQNRKSNDEKRWRNQAKETVDLYIEAIYAEVRHRDMAYESRSVIGMSVDFLGEIPKGSGFSGFCKLGAKIDRMARDTVTCEHRNAVAWLNRLPEIFRDAMVYDRALRGREKIVAVDPLRPRDPVTKLWTDKLCAEDLHCSESAFKKRISDGYFELERVMGLRERQAA
ncbi:hypothetical protein [Marinobacter salarius]|uniref:Uncharacterized protein n=1 Tax=Marinobacter salarius TaxID=1420917 RepID=A0A1W6K976_9GAMM|nr:hypothetical protein [Marinobacter salarius]ARM83973.1 hypothetical protein MARSALSMR5_01895 [Marinobacter salarius]